MKISKICLVVLIYICTISTVNAAITNIQNPPNTIDVIQGTILNLTWKMDLSLSDALVAINIPDFSVYFSYTINNKSINILKVIRNSDIM